MLLRGDDRSGVLVELPLTQQPLELGDVVHPEPAEEDE